MSRPKFTRIIVVAILGLSAGVLTAQNKTGNSGDKQLASGPNYILFLHNQFVEENGPDGIHPLYGAVEYNKIIKAFTKEKFIVLNELRPRYTDINTYAKKVSLQLDSLVKTGIKPSQITVVGASKGGSIAMQVSAMLKNEKMNFVFIACCSKGTDQEINMCGNILSIYENSDEWSGSCVKLKEKSLNKVSRFKEIELNTGLKHGFQFKALRAWIDPCIKWARENNK